jgi:Papain-like cysteine protease AvrRpt2
LQPSEIAAVQTGSRATPEDVKPGELSTPIINITTPTSLPDPAGTAAILAAIQKGDMFRDMSGLQATIGLAQAALQATSAGAATAGQQAGTNMNNLLQANTERQRIAAQMLTELAKTAASMYTGGAVGGGGSGVSGGSNHSQDGAKINYFDKARELHTGTAGAGSANGGSGAASPVTNEGQSGGGQGVNGIGTGSGHTEASSYSQNPAATWGDSQPPASLLNRVIDKMDTGLGFDIGEGEGAASNYAVPGDIPILGQQKTKGCWATVAAMMVSWKRQTSYSPETVTSEAGSRYRTMYDSNMGLLPADKSAFLGALQPGMVSEPPQSYTVGGLLNLMMQYGLLWIATDAPGTFSPHARILCGMRGDGTPAGTNVDVIDPLGGGRRYMEKFTQLMQEMEQLAIQDNAAHRDRIMISHFQ